MILNGTIIVQAFNFLLFYSLFSRFFLKFAVDTVNKQNEYINSLHAELKKTHDKIVEYEQYKSRAWNECKKNASELKPDVEGQIEHVVIEPDIKGLQPNKSEKKDLYVKLKEIVLKRID